MKTYSILFFLLLVSQGAATQELYVFSDPASNVPARSLSIKYTGKMVRTTDVFLHTHNMSRHMLESSIGLNRKWMIRPILTVSDMYTDRKQKLESFGMYTKFRFYSADEVHKHFRAAAFAKAVYSSNALKYDELTGDGDQSAAQLGLVLTQLVGKLAVSSTLAWNEVLDSERWLKYDGPRNFGYSSFNYSISAGYLVFPRSYSSYKQTNFNVYLEMIGSRGLDRKVYFVDLAPALQLIINSNTKVNLGYRFQLDGLSKAYRMSFLKQGTGVVSPSILFSVERTFLNTFRK
jgi:hypothetical protein